MKKNVRVRAFDPWFGCTQFSPGCENCYPKVWDDALGRKCWGHNPREMNPDFQWLRPIRWNEKSRVDGIRRRVVVARNCDWADERGLVGQRERMWELIRNTPHLDWLMISRRAHNIEACLPPDWCEGYQNVWLGVAVEEREYVDRIEILRKIQARMRFIEFSPLLDDVGILNLSGISWAVARHEFLRTRPTKGKWVDNIRRQCLEQGVEFFAPGKNAYRLAKGHSHGN